MELLLPKGLSENQAVADPTKPAASANLINMLTIGRQFRYTGIFTGTGVELLSKDK
jgi:hypothetical protein